MAKAEFTNFVFFVQNIKVLNEMKVRTKSTKSKKIRFSGLGTRKCFGIDKEIFTKIAADTLVVSVIARKLIFSTLDQPLLNLKFASEITNRQ